MKLSLKKISLLLFGYLLVTNIQAQKIEISQPQQAGKEYVFILNQGLKMDTIQRGIVSFVGGVTVNIPEKYKGYAGMANFNTADGQSLRLVINNEDFSIEQLAGEAPQFTNSKENSYLYHLMQGVKIEPDTSLYAYRFIEMMRYLQSLNAIIYKNEGGLYERANALIYGTSKLNLDDLYTSGLWYFGIDGILKLSGDQENFGNNMVDVLKRIKSDAVFEALSKDLITITEQYGYDDAFDIIVPYIQQTGRIQVPTGSLYTAFALAKIQKGSVVPAISGLKKPLGNEQVLLVFYQPDCHNCEAQIQELIGKYAELKAKNIRVISISASYDKTENEIDNKRFPWADNICDFKGFAGSNFINYGITSTPTFFLTDKDHKLIKRFALTADLSKYID